MTHDGVRPLGRRALTGVSFAVLVAVALVVTVSASARTADVPQNTAPPTISGTPDEGQTLTASNGTWDNNPTKFAYQWQRWTSAGTGCGDVTGAQEQKYDVAGGDVGHTLRVVVTASNADGQSSSISKSTDLVSSRGDPVNTAKPGVTGTARVGDELTASNGTWTGGVHAFSYQWQRCSAGTSNCADVSGATGKTYGVRSADAGNTLRVIVTATNASGTSTATSDTTGTVSPTPGANPAPAPATRHRNRPPTISFLSLRHAGRGVYARFRVCDDSRKQVLVIQRDVKARALGYTRRFSVTPITCSTATRHWVPAVRFRTPGRLVVTLRAVDKSGASSRTVSRGLRF
jgi:hypothetical protein